VALSELALAVDRDPVVAHRLGVYRSSESATRRPVRSTMSGTAGVDVVSAGVSVVVSVFLRFAIALPSVWVA
jgi:hypothetical protein